tara:strand:- start:1747 stop:2142 length:396 start_codon:yes stop_codon:yes gene_type:complete
MKYEVKGLFSYGVYDGDRLLGTYESEKTAQCVADALNDEAARVDGAVKSAYRSGVDFERARNQVVPGPVHQYGETSAETLDEEAGRDLEPLQGLGWSVEERQQIAGAKHFPPIAGDGNASAFPNGQDKETT